MKVNKLQILTIAFSLLLIQNFVFAQQNLFIPTSKVANNSGGNGGNGNGDSLKIDCFMNDATHPGQVTVDLNFNLNNSDPLLLNSTADGYAIKLNAFDGNNDTLRILGFSDRLGTSSYIPIQNSNDWIYELTRFTFPATYWSGSLKIWIDNSSNNTAIVRVDALLGSSQSNVLLGLNTGSPASPNSHTVIGNFETLMNGVLCPNINQDYPDPLTPHDPSRFSRESIIYPNIVFSPNPVSSSLNITIFEHNLSYIEFTMWDIKGSRVFSEKVLHPEFLNQNLSTRIDISHLNSGLYYVMISTNSETQRFKLLKE